MDSQNPQQFQLLIHSPHTPFPNRTLTLTLDQAKQTTFHDLKLNRLGLGLGLDFSSLFFSFNGKTLLDSSTIFSSLTVNGKIPSLSTLTLRHKLLGGGGDGGATGAESRDCYLNMYAEKKPDKIDPNEKRLSKWTTCALSFEPLSPPCVVDRLGNVFNKESIVKALISKSLPREFGYIKRLKDLIAVQLSPIPGEKNRFHCPITGLEFNGKCKFFVLTKCGHVLSAKALKEVKSSGCLVCHQEFDGDDKLVVNGSDDEVAVLRERMDEEKKSTRLKKDKEKKDSNKRNVVDTNGVGSSKRFKAVDIAPANANKKVYASIFTSSRKSDFKETFSCRSLPLGRN